MSATQQEAERFAMCMAEAGYPVQNVRVGEDGQLFWAPDPRRLTPDYWRAVWRARLLVGRPPVGVCLDCYVATKLAVPSLVGLTGASCEHTR